MVRSACVRLQRIEPPHQDLEQAIARRLLGIGGVASTSASVRRIRPRISRRAREFT